MARETKVGLVVGLGLILFVGMMVSEYFVDDPGGMTPTPAFANFTDSTTNQDERIRPDDTTPGALPAQDPSFMAAVALERAERRDGPPVVDVPGIERTYIEPQFRESVGPLVSRTPDDETPIARRPYSPPSDPLGERRLDDPRLAAGHQLSHERLGPDVIDLEPLLTVLPEPVPIAPRPRQVMHTVKANETLRSISRLHYDGDPNLWRSIRDANPGKVGPNGEVLQDAVLVIPKRSAQADDPALHLSQHAAGEHQTFQRRRVRLITVKEGQTLSEIAYKELGSGNKWPKIMEVNDDVLDKPENLRAGMTLRIPVDELEAVAEQANNALTGNGNGNAQAPQPEPRPEPAPAVKTYTVKSGDSLYRIAEKELGNGERFKEIFEANRDKLRSADDIRVGMVLKLPKR